MSETDHTHQYAVSATGDSETRTTVSVRDFEFVVDEPADAGGTDEGPTPVEYLLGAWAGCLNVVIHTVAEERGIEIDDVAFELEGDLDPRKFMGLAEDVRAGYQDVRVRIEVDADADQDELEALCAETEERCPIADNVANPTPTDVRIVPA